MFVNAKRRIPEFSGFKANYYPGQMGPRTPTILPRRIEPTQPVAPQPPPRSRVIFVKPINTEDIGEENESRC